MAFIAGNNIQNYNWDNASLEIIMIVTKLFNNISDIVDNINQVHLAIFLIV